MAAPLPTGGTTAPAAPATVVNHHTTTPANGAISTTLALLGGKPPPDTPSNSGSDAEDDFQEPPGSPDPSKFMVSGPGLNGGAAGTLSTLYVSARDSNRRRVTHAGDDVVVTVVPSSGTASKEPVAATVTDKGDGTYVATYTVPGRGNYLIGVEVEGLPVEGSPFPVFFAPPGSDVQPPPSTSAAVPAPAAPGTGTGNAATDAALVRAAIMASGGGAAVSRAPKIVPTAGDTVPSDPKLANTMTSAAMQAALGGGVGGPQLATITAQVRLVGVAAAGN